MENTDVKRKALSKQMRALVYQKYDGHCAYCGCELTMKEMQVDHLESLYWYGGSEEIANYMPSCRMCNFYKSTLTLEKFRGQLQTMTERLEKQFIYRLAKKYNIVTEQKEPKVIFYFEKMQAKTENHQGEREGTENGIL